MLFTLIATIGLLLALMMAWIEVQRLARHVAEQHPEAGPLRLVWSGCGGSGHGEEAVPAIKPAPKPEGCATCANTDCKPGAPPDPSCAELHPLLPL